jgi:hypothetical protein
MARADGSTGSTQFETLPQWRECVAFYFVAAVARTRRLKDREISSAPMVELVWTGFSIEPFVAPLGPSGGARGCRLPGWTA